MLTSRGHRVHVDLIVAPDGACTGVTPEELVLIREAVPGARLDVHLIILDAGPAAPGLTAPAWRSAKAAIRTAQQVKAETLALSPDAMRTFSEILTSPPDNKPAVWAEVAVGAQMPNLGGAEGALVMLIESGTKNAADRTQLGKIPALATLAKVGIDGGVTPSVAADARAAGAVLIVSGRALLENNQ
jgi:pentose-5-phosphate-3-epimerase